MIVYPAIDIRGGRCVRLVEGDFSRETMFDADPSAAATRWAEAGATWLHVVDLDGAVAGHPVNVESIQKIARSVDIPIQLGGGLRTRADVEAVFAVGVERAIIGTAAIHDHEFVASLASEWPGRIAVGLDARDGLLAAAGWLEQTEVRAIDVAATLTDSGVRHLIYTDIRRDGTLVGPNLDALSEMIGVGGQAVIASGGIGGIADVKAVLGAGAGGVIIGRALYDGRVDLAEAIQLAATGAGSS